MQNGSYVDFTQYPAGQRIRARALMDTRYCKQIRDKRAETFSSIVGNIDLSNDDDCFDWFDHMEAHAFDYKQGILEHGNPKAKNAAWHTKKRENNILRGLLKSLVLQTNMEILCLVALFLTSSDV